MYNPLSVCLMQNKMTEYTLGVKKKKKMFKPVITKSILNLQKVPSRANIRKIYERGICGFYVIVVFENLPVIVLSPPPPSLQRPLAGRRILLIALGSEDIKSWSRNDETD